MKRILVLGVTSAIAQECSRVWAKQGAILYIVARNDERLHVIADDLRVRGAKEVHTRCLDLNILEQHKDLIEKIISTLNRLDIVLVAHGTLPNQSRCEQSVSEALAEINTNAISVISLLTVLANYFESVGAGSIAVVSSVAGDRGRASNYVYGSAKSMVTSFTSGLRQRLYKKNVTVTTIKPGFVDTPMTARFKKNILWAKPSIVAQKIVQAIDQKKSVAYVPFFWAYIMLVIRLLPEKIFRKLYF